VGVVTQKNMRLLYETGRETHRRQIAAHRVHTGPLTTGPTYGTGLLLLPVIDGLFFSLSGTNCVLPRVTHQAVAIGLEFRPPLSHSITT
jgi:hypothetical protein